MASLLLLYGYPFATKCLRNGDTMKKVSMKLTDQDMSNVESLQERFGFDNKASVVSVALAASEYLTRRIANGDELILRYPSDFGMGRLGYHIIIPGLNDPETVRRKRLEKIGKILSWFYEKRNILIPSTTAVLSVLYIAFLLWHS